MTDENRVLEVPTVVEFDMEETPRTVQYSDVETADIIIP